jgi:hypothetical protein
MARAELHSILAVLSGSLEKLGKLVDPSVLERCALVIHRAMAGDARWFHTSDHVITLARGGGPIESLAALFHDVVYLQVDQGLPAELATHVSAYIAADAAGVTVLPAPAGASTSEDVFEVFGVKAGDRLSVYAGANEVASALVAAGTLRDILSAREVVEIAACIEGTIPFRNKDAEGNGPMDRLFHRLCALDARRSLGMGEAGCETAVKQAVWLANRDVEGFADPDAATFLDGTWQLLPESTPSLRNADVYTVTQYRTALSKMAGFLGGLDGGRVFQRFRGTPPDAEYEELRSRVKQNLEISVRYLRIKLLAMGYIESLALATGGDAPLELFMGSIQENGHRLERHLPPSPAGWPPGVHPVLWSLVQSGRRAPSSFDLQHAPLSAFLYSRLGDAQLPDAWAQADRLFRGEIGPLEFLKTQPRELVQAVIQAASHIASTRKVALLALPVA